MLSVDFRPCKRLRLEECLSPIYMLVICNMVNYALGDEKLVQRSRLTLLFSSQQRRIDYRFVLAIFTHTALA